MTVSIPLPEVLPLMSAACCMQHILFPDQQHEELHAFFKCAANQGIESIRTPWLLQCLQLLLPHAKGCCACLEAKLCCQSCHTMMLCHSHIRQGSNDTDHGHVHDARLHMMQLQPNSAAALTYSDIRWCGCLQVQHSSSPTTHGS